MGLSSIPSAAFRGQHPSDRRLLGRAPVDKSARVWRLSQPKSDTVDVKRSDRPVFDAQARNLAKVARIPCQ
jgi:hypothetical protein